jgi:hypothetical protein
MNQFDKENVKSILLEHEGDWFTADLFRLIAKADNNNRAKLFKVFPDEVDTVHKYLTGKDYEATLPGTNWWRRLLKRNGA